MLKKSYFFFIAFALLVGTTHANQKADQQTDTASIIEKRNEAIKKSEQNIYLIEQIYENIAREYDQKEIEIYDTKIHQAVEEYLRTCLQEKTNITNTKAIKDEINNLLQYLLSQSKEDAAYATASMLFMARWSKLITKIALEVKTKKEIENLQLATAEITDLIETLFLNPMAEIAENSQPTI